MKTLLTLSLVLVLTACGKQGSPASTSGAGNGRASIIDGGTDAPEATPEVTPAPTPAPAQFCEGAVIDLTFQPPRWNACKYQVNQLDLSEVGIGTHRQYILSAWADSPEAFISSIYLGNGLSFDAAPPEVQAVVRNLVCSVIAEIDGAQ